MWILGPLAIQFKDTTADTSNCNSIYIYGHLRAYVYRECEV